MKILIYSINYSPDLTGIGKYTGEMGAWLANQGHNVDVITAMPYYPQWEIDKAYKGHLWHSEYITGVKVYRCPLYVPKKVTATNRIIHELSFFLSSTVFWFRTIFKKYDIVISPYPPLLIGLWPWLYKQFHRKSTWVFHVQDLQVDAARELNLIKSRAVLLLLEKIELFWLQKADRVSSISEGMKARILSKGINPDKYIMLPNWAEIEVIKPLSIELSIREELGIPGDKKVILYSGNLGEKQGIEIIIDAAKAFKDNEQVLFVIAGEGTSKSKLKEYAQHKKVDNVLFLPLQSYSKLASFLAIANIHLVLQKKSAADLVLPSKFMSILSAGGVAVVTTEENTSLFNMITTHKLAYVCEPDNIQKLVEVLQNVLIQDSTLISKQARVFAENNLSIDSILKDFQEALIK